MFYKYQVTYWEDSELRDGCGIVFGDNIQEGVDCLSQWYGYQNIASLALNAIDVDVTFPLLDFNSDYKVLEAAVEAVEK